jgi:hypothetical protein
MRIETFIKQNKIAHALLYPKLGLSPTIFSSKLNKTGGRFSFTEDEKRLLVNQLQQYGNHILKYTDKLKSTTFPADISHLNK